MADMIINDNGLNGLEPREQAQLRQITAGIKESMARAEARLRSSVKYALKAGKLLCDAKEIVPSRQWLRWFEASDFNFSESSANRYMRLHRR